MKHILRQAALTTLFVLGLYSLALGMTFVLAPAPPRSGAIDVWTAGDTIYLTLPKYAFLGRDVLNLPDPRVLLVGASNTGFGLRRLPPRLPCAQVSNLSLGSANISELRQLIDLIHDVQDDAARRSNTFVIGVWFGMFADTELRWPGNDRHRGDTDLDIERYRYGFYRRTAAGPVEVLPPRWLHTGVVLLRPFLLLEKVARDVTAAARARLFVHPPVLTDADREGIILSESDRQDALAYWRQSMGHASAISQAQVALLQDTIDVLLRSGERVVLIDLPIPAWHRDASPYQPGYVRAIGETFARFAGRAGFTALAMADLDGDADYSDEVHPKPHLARVWVDRLAAVLNPLVCPSVSARNVPVTRTDAPIAFARRANAAPPPMAASPGP